MVSSSEIAVIEQPHSSDTSFGKNQADTKEFSKEAEHTNTNSKSGVPTANGIETSSLIVPGSVGAVKNLYQSKKDSDDKWKWVEEYPEDVPEAEEVKGKANYAIVLGNIKSPDPETTRTMQAEIMTVQSPWLKKALGGHILKNYPGVTCELSKLEFKAPFAPFVHRWRELLKCRLRQNLDATTAEHINLLHDILKQEIGEHIELHEDYILTGVITFEHLWMIFQPGGTVLSEARGAMSAYELVDSEYIETDCGEFLRLKCEYVNWNGKYFGRSTENIDLAKFRGTKKIEDLEAFPLRFHNGSESIKKDLIERGEKFESLAGYQYMAYSGMAITWRRDGTEQPIEVSGRIIVDTDAFNRFSYYRRPSVSGMTQKDNTMISKYREKQENVDEKGKTKRKWWRKRKQNDNLHEIELTPYHQMLCTARVRGYSLKLKKWLEFWVDLVSEIHWNTTAFDSLVLPKDHKDLILSFIESQVKNGQAFDDVIQGKGKGIIMLLSGSPGIGKTLTAEAVAEHMRVPLHTITSGDLGSSAWDVESRLSNVLDLVAQWNAILLLDECDVFLEARSTHDLKRNQIVSIFLRTLEYYEGILFMTTNRVDNIDAAFQSRIHVSLEYPDLTPSSRRQIWVNIVDPIDHDFSEADFDELSKIELNGRQIKNVLKTAQLLARRRAIPLDRTVLETVLAIEQRRMGARETVS